MAIPKNEQDTHRQYARYAVHCLGLVASVKSQDARINREMAAE